MQRYSVYGLVLSSDFPFTYPLPEYRENSGSPALHVRFTCVQEPPVDWRTATLAYTAPMRARSGEPLCRIYDLSGGEAIRITGVGDYALRDDAILCHPVEPIQKERVELFLLGIVLARWLERADTPALHASAVATDCGAVAFAASNRGGKSSLAVALMQGGDSLLTDDILALRRADYSLHGDAILAYPAYPQMRMWPEHAGHFVENPDDLEVVLQGIEKRRIPLAETDLGRFEHQPRPLAAIYLPDRRDPEVNGSAITSAITIEPVARGKALFTLIRHSFATGFANAAAHQQQRMTLLAPVVERVPVRRLIYPSGVAELPSVRSAILDDLGTITENR